MKENPINLEQKFQNNGDNIKTIFSLVTKPINQNVAIIRISGFDFFDKISNLFKIKISNKKELSFHKLYYKDLFIDDVLFLTFKAPHSFTGEDVIEIQFHGSIFIVKKIINALLSIGIEQATPGEFTKRAFLNSKIDLTQSEAINGIINSENELLTQASSNNLNMTQSLIIKDSLFFLEDIISRFQVAIDYPENTDLPKYSMKELLKSLVNFSQRIKNIIISSKTLIKYSSGIKISFLGIPNSGKSTLFNCLINEEKAIVSNVAGTTRDVVEAIYYFDGIKVTFQDTAGHRKTKNIIEKKGILKTENIISDSDLIILLLDSTKSIKNQEKYFSNYLEKYHSKIIKTLTKGDLSKNKKAISAKFNKISFLFKEIKRYISSFNLKLDESILINENQVKTFEEIYSLLENAILAIKNNSSDDLVFIDIEQAMKLLGKLIGKNIDHEYITNLFSKFCLGK